MYLGNQNSKSLIENLTFDIEFAEFPVSLGRLRFERLALVPRGVRQRPIQQFEQRSNSGETSERLQNERIEIDAHVDSSGPTHVSPAADARAKPPARLSSPCARRLVQRLLGRGALTASFPCRPVGNQPVYVP